MSLLDKLTSDMKAAMRARDASRLSAIRMLVSAVRYVGIDSGEMSDDKVIAVLKKEAKKRREAIEAYEKAGRVESAAQEAQELSIIETYLPQMMSESEVRKVVSEILAKGQFANFGAAMGAVMRQVEGQADGGGVSKIVKELYQ